MKRRDAQQGLLIVCVTFFAFAGVLRGGFAWDDGAMTTSPLLKSPGGFADFWIHPARNVNEEHYWPLVYSVFWVEHWLWGLQPLGFHLVNIMLHAANALLLWRILRNLRIHGALFCAVLFAIHPTRAESVAWVIELKDVLSGLFYFLAFWCYLKHRDSRGERPFTSALVFSLMCFLCAMLSKSIAVTLPASLLLVVWWKENRITRRDLIDTGYYVVIAIAALAADFVTIASHAERAQITLSLPARFIIAGRAWWFYLWKLAWPFNLMAVYPSWTINPANVLQYLFPLGALALLVWLFAIRKRIGRGPFAAVAFFTITLLPVLGFIPFGFMQWSLVADRFQYLAAIGPFALVAAYGAGLKLRLVKGQRGRIKWLAVAASVVLIPITMAHANLYGNSTQLFQDNLARNPNSWVVHLNLAKAYEDERQFPSAFRQYEEVLKLNPSSWLAHYNLANLLSQHGPEVGNYAAGLQAEGDYIGDAIKHYESAIAIRPDYADAHINLGNLLRDQKKPDAAMTHYKAALNSRPGDPWIHYSLFLCAMDKKDFAEAKKQIDAALQIDPSNADFQAARAYYRAHNN